MPKTISSRLLLSRGTSEDKFYLSAETYVDWRNAREDSYFRFIRKEKELDRDRGRRGKEIAVIVHSDEVPDVIGALRRWQTANSIGRRLRDFKRPPLRRYLVPLLRYDPAPWLRRPERGEVLLSRRDRWGSFTITERKFVADSDQSPYYLQIVRRKTGRVPTFVTIYFMDVAAVIEVMECRQTELYTRRQLSQWG